MGRGEAACIVIAARDDVFIASDERGRFLREATARLGADRVLRTVDLFLLAIREGQISIEEADAAKELLESRRFKLPFASFRDLAERDYSGFLLT